MKHQRIFERTRFSEVAIRETVTKFDELFRTRPNLKVRQESLTTEHGNSRWEFDNEDEFFAIYSNADIAHYRRRVAEDDFVSQSVFQLHYAHATSTVSVETDQDCLEAGQRGSIQTVFQVLSKHEEDCRLPSEPDDANPKPVVFIGHGRSQSWRDLKDHLTDKHDYRVEAYEAGARAGHAVRDILQSMLELTSIAFLVLAKEDETAEGKMRARQNVIHETGLFQGRLGFSRAIVLLEEGTEDFSNISGIEQLRFKKIQETFGDVIAILKREFG